MQPNTNRERTGNREKRNVNGKRTWKEREGHRTNRTTAQEAGFSVRRKPDTKTTHHYSHPREFIGTEPEDTKEQTNELPFIKLKIEDMELTALVDTGSQISLIKKEVLQEKLERYKDKIIRVKKIKLVGANSKKLAELDNVLVTEAHVGEERIPCSLIIAPHLNMQVIVGADFLKEAKAKIDLEKRVMKIGKEEVKLENIGSDHGSEKSTMTQKLEDAEEVSEKRLTKAKITCPIPYDTAVQKMLEEHQELINYKPRIANTYVHELKIEKDKPFVCKRYPIPYKYKEQVKKELLQMEKDGIIEKAQTNYINPLVIVKKKDGSIRLCLDARKINEITKPQYDSPQNIDVLITKIQRNCIFTKLDLKNSFWLIPLHPESRKLTGFSVDGQVYQFRTVAFGLQSATAALSCALRQVLDAYDSFCVYYVDDILIFSSDSVKHEKHVKKIYKARQNRNWKHVRFKEGDLVVVKQLRVTDWDKDRCAKLMLPFKGPYIVHKTIGNNTYQLKEEDTGHIIGKYHVEMLYPYPTDEHHVESG